jgi:hypothetical protein
MRRLAIFLSLVLLCCGCASVQPQLEGGSAVEVARVPDSNFRGYLLENNFVKPANTSRRLRHAEEWVEITPLGRATQLIDCHKKNIQSLEGIQLFPNLVILICGENPIQHLDLCHNPKLKQLVAIETPLRSLDISRNAALKVLQISYNQLRSLDISHNPQLEELLCIFAPGITRLDLSHNPHLRTLYIRETSIQLVDLRANPTFRSLHAYDTPLQYIVVSPQHNLDSIGADVEDYVQVLSLPLSDPLPQMEEIEISDSLFAAMPVQKKRVQRVLTHQQAQAEGLDEKHLRDVVYRPAWTFDTLSKTFEDWGLVRNDKDLVQFILTWKLFLQGIAEEMEEQHLQMDRPYRGHCVVMFAEDGYADYFLYNFLGDERPSEEQQRRFEQVMRTYIANNPLGYYGSRPFSQCGGFILQPHGIDSDEE